MRKHLVIATRGSALALWQANFIKKKLEDENPEYNVSLNIIKTKGDLILDRPLANIGGKGLFVKEIEEALLENRADIAVHSIKDVPMDLPEGLILGCVPERMSACDCFLSETYPSVEYLPQGALAGTSSLRRKAQLKALRPDVEIAPLRGNVDTRLQKLKNGDYDAIILAEAGLSRLGLSAKYMQSLNLSVMLPAAGQGALGIECKEDNYDVLVLLSSLEDRNSRVCVTAERAFLKTLNGSCQTPIAANAMFEDEETILLQGLIAMPNGIPVLRSQISGHASQAESLGMQLAKELLEQGGKEILEKL